MDGCQASSWIGAWTGRGLAFMEEVPEIIPSNAFESTTLF